MVRMVAAALAAPTTAFDSIMAQCHRCDSSNDIDHRPARKVPTIISLFAQLLIRANLKFATILAFEEISRYYYRLERKKDKVHRVEDRG